MDIETLKKITALKTALRSKLEENGKRFNWFWENSILGNNINCTYSHFMGCLNGNSGEIKPEIEEEINKYLAEEKRF